MTISTDKAGTPVLHLTRRLIIFITALLALSTLSGCSTGLGVSRQNDLVRTRSDATNSYSGKHTDAYHGFTSTRRPPFGGSGKHATIHVTSEASGIQGTGTVLVTDRSDMKRPLPVHQGTFDQTYTLDGSCFYIYASGNHFTGSLTLMSEQFMSLRSALRTGSATLRTLISTTILAGDFCLLAR